MFLKYSRPLFLGHITAFLFKELVQMIICLTHSPIIPYSPQPATYSFLRDMAIDLEDLILSQSL